MGGVVTLIIYFYVFAYASLKFTYFITRNKPTMFAYLKESEYQINREAINLGERNFRMAFTVENLFGPWKLKNDERYVKWIFRLVGERDGRDFQHIL